MANILVVDDELGIRDLLFEILNDEGHNVELAENAAEARAARQRARPDLVLLDIWMPDTDGVTLLKEWSTAGLLTMPVIMMKILSVATTDKYRKKIRDYAERYGPECWVMIYQADVRFRYEKVEKVRRECVRAHSLAVSSAGTMPYDENRPGNYTFMK